MILAALPKFFERLLPLPEQSFQAPPGLAGTGVLTVDEFGQVIEADEAARDLLDCEQPLGQKFRDFLVPGDAIEFDLAIAGAPVRSTLRVNLPIAPGRYCLLGEREKRLDLFLDPIENVINILIVDRSAYGDDQKNLIKERDAALKAADTARQAAKKSAERLADLSHEMRTPLNAVIGFADAMRSETFGPLGNEKYVEYADDISTSGGHLLSLATSILDLAKIDADRMKLQREMVDIGDIAREAAAIVRHAADEAGLVLDVQIDDELPRSSLDPRAIRQILINLLSNAIKFTSDGSVTLRVGYVGEKLRLIVTDTGVGMSREELAKLGARFTSAQAEGVRGAGGAGIGLALAHAFARMHEGDLTFESAPGEGVEATLSLPVVEAVTRHSSDRAGLLSTLDDDKMSNDEPQILSQLDRVEAYRKEIASRRAAA